MPPAVKPDIRDEKCRECLVPCIWADQARGVQPTADWLPGRPPHPGSRRANPSPIPASPETLFSFVPLRAGAGERAGAPRVRVGAGKVGRARAGGRAREP
jgi:hypothetical protein